MYIKFVDGKSIIPCKVKAKGNIVTLTFDKKMVVNTSGFRVYLDANGNNDIGGNSYLGYNTVYRNDEETQKTNSYQLSNDGTVFAPIIKFVSDANGKISGESEQSKLLFEDLKIPTPVPNQNYVFEKWVPEIPESGLINEDIEFEAQFSYVAPLDEVKANKINELREIQQQVIEVGLDVTLSDGTVEHFTLTEYDRNSLMGLQTQVAVGANEIPWHTSDIEEHCKYYSNADMAIITQSALAYVTYHETYYRDLRIFVLSMESKNEVESAFYGMVIPEQYQSQVLKDLLLQM